MRTIKFRGKCDKDSRYSGEWVYGACVQCEKSNDVLIIYAINDRSSCIYHVDPDTIGQFTGLLDKNDKEIYEGDIIKIPTKHGDKVFWIGYELSHIGAFCLCDIDGFVSIFGRNYEYEPFDCEVIGNIHDNPKLLENERETNN